MLIVQQEHKKPGLVGGFKRERKVGGEERYVFGGCTECRRRDRERGESRLIKRKKNVGTFLKVQKKIYLKKERQHCTKKLIPTIMTD